MKAICCIRCGEEGTVKIDADSAEMNCTACEEVYSVGDVEELIAGWTQLIPWIKSHPALVEEAAAN